MAAFFFQLLEFSVFCYVTSVERDNKSELPLSDYIFTSKFYVHILLLFMFCFLYENNKFSWIRENCCLIGNKSEKSLLRKTSFIRFSKVEVFTPEVSCKMNRIQNVYGNFMSFEKVYQFIHTFSISINVLRKNCKKSVRAKKTWCHGVVKRAFNEAVETLDGDVSPWH